MKVVNWLLALGMIIGVLYYLVFNFSMDRLIIYLIIVPVLMVPLMLFRTRFRLDVRDLFGYYLFMFMSYFLGCVVDLYNLINWYDTLVHFSSGIFLFLVGLFILDRIKIGDNNLIFKLFFCFCFVIMVAGIWELIEFFLDKLLGLNMQRSMESGVDDTMIDMLVAFGGVIISCMGYYFFSSKRSVKNG